MTRRDERRLGSSRLIPLHADDGAFDRAFWRAVPPAARLEQVWQMVQEFEAARTGACPPRLQRSMVRLQRRKR